MNHEESRLQQACVNWFRGEYPEYAMLLTHPINEGSKDTRVSGAIHKAEGTVAGVPDLLFFLPSYMPAKRSNDYDTWTMVHGLGIEFKTLKGRQSEEQKKFQTMFQAAGYDYHIIRSLEEFQVLMLAYIGMTYEGRRSEIKIAWTEITEEAERKEKEHFYKVIGKK